MDWIEPRRSTGVGSSCSAVCKQARTYRNQRQQVSCATSNSSLGSTLTATKNTTLRQDPRTRRSGRPVRLPSHAPPARVLLPQSVRSRPGHLERDGIAALQWSWGGGGQDRWDLSTAEKRRTRVGSLAEVSERGRKRGVVEGRRGVCSRLCFQFVGHELERAGVKEIQ